MFAVIADMSPHNPGKGYLVSGNRLPEIHNPGAPPALSCRALLSGPMDATDVRIFCELAFKEMAIGISVEKELGPAAIARKLRVDEKTVRLRIRKMEESGFIKYYQATPELGLFGIKHIGICRFEAMNIATKLGAVRYAEGLPGTLETSDYLGPTFAVSIASASAERAGQLADDLARHFELQKVSLGGTPVGEPKSKPDRLDWQIIAALRYDARSSQRDLAQALSISQRMADYRVRKIKDGGAVRIRAVLNPQKQEGLVFYELAVTVEPDRKTAVLRAVRERHKERLWAVRELPEGVLMLNLFGFTLAEPEEAAMALLPVPGVRWCTIFILKEMLEPARPNWIDHLIDQKIAAGRAALPADRGAPGPPATRT
jgi:DNA-binding Lrp family transcriptional regulator